MKKFIIRLLKDESGATAIEYGLLAALLGVAIIGLAQSEFAFGLKVGFDQLGDSFKENSDF
jgi:pilus assembly protein Flp/PilA